MWRRWIGLSCLSVCLAGCGIKPGAGSADCDWAAPIRPAQADALTPGTQRQILAHNETGAALCGWRP